MVSKLSTSSFESQSICCWNMQKLPCLLDIQRRCHVGTIRPKREAHSLPLRAECLEPKLNFHSLFTARCLGAGQNLPTVNMGTLHLIVENTTLTAAHCWENTTLTAVRYWENTTVTAAHCWENTTLTAAHCWENTTLTAVHCWENITVTAAHCWENTILTAAHC
jgi:hypothetical protein